MPTACELCADPLNGRGHDLIGGLALCMRCFQGDLQRVAQARGWTLWSQHLEYKPRESDDICYVTRVRIVLAEERVVRVVCQRRRWWMGLVGLLRGRARSRDPLFEAHVRVWTPAPAPAEAFLGQAGVESSLLDVLGNLLTSRVEIRGASLSVVYSGDDPHTEGEIVARACVLAHHVERFVD
jgi:hypothetical protein